MKIIQVDNYSRETVSERLIAENIGNGANAHIMCRALCDNPMRPDSAWYLVVSDDHALYEFKP